MGGRIAVAPQQGDSTISIQRPTDPELQGVMPQPQPAPKIEKTPWKAPRTSLILLGVFVILCLAAVGASSYRHNREGDEIGDFDECRQKTDNCSTTTERCENTVGSFLCIPCPLYHVPTDNGLACSLGECPLDFSPSQNGETCIIDCRSGYMEISEGLRCKADVCAPSGQLMAEQKINSIEGGLRHEVMPGDRFGAAVARMGDVDGNGAVDFAVGSSQRQQHGHGTTSTMGFGSVTIIFSNPDNTVLSHTVIGTSYNGQTAAAVGGLANPMDRYDYFGASLACLGDLDRDGVPDLIVGAPGDDDGGTDQGALYVLFMLATGSVKSQQKISATTTGTLHRGIFERLGLWAVGVVGEADKVNGVVGVVAATYNPETHVVYFMELNLDGTMKSVYELWRSMDGGSEVVNPASRWWWIGGAVGVGDVDGNGVVDIAVGTPAANTEDEGAVVVLLMPLPSNNDGGGGRGPREETRTTPSMFGWKDQRASRFGSSVAGLGDLDGDGTPDLAVGTVANMGVVHLLLLNPDGTVKGANVISNTEGGLVGPRLSLGDDFGSSVATLVVRGDSEEGVVTLVVGASRDPATMEDGGAVYILTVHPGFVEVCPGEDEKCIHSGDDGYTCG